MDNRTKLVWGFIALLVLSLLVYDFWYSSQFIVDPCFTCLESKGCSPNCAGHLIDCLDRYPECSPNCSEFSQHYGSY